MQTFAARERFEFPNGAIGWSPGGPMDCLGPWAKVNNCPIHGTDLRRTAYATRYADTYFSIPAVTRYKGRRITGYLTTDNDGGALFRPHTDQLEKLKTMNTEHMSLQQVSDAFRNGLISRSEAVKYCRKWNAGPHFTQAIVRHESIVNMDADRALLIYPKHSKECGVRK